MTDEEFNAGRVLAQQQSITGAHPMTANESYQARTKSINAKLSQLRTLLMDHAREQKSEPTNWGCSGDLGYVELQLDSMVDFLAGNDTDPVPV